MKNKLFLFLLLFLCQIAVGQRNLPLIHARSTDATIIEGTDGDRIAWRLAPEARPDVHIIAKSPGPKRIWFCTDTDTLSIKLKPGQHFDFIVLLNGRDSCYTRLESKAPVTRYAKQRQAGHDTIPFILTEYNNIKIKVCLNHSDTLYLKFDSGATGLLLTHEAIAQKTTLLSDQTGVREGLAKPDYGKMSPYNTLNIGRLSWDSLSVYPVVLSGQGTDGRFGWDLFDGRVVEIDYDKRLFIVHTSLPKIAGGYSKLPIEYTQGLFCIRGALVFRGKKYKNRFLFDSGYQRTIMLDTTLLARQNVPADLPVLKKTIMKNGQGKEFPVITVNNERLSIGKTTLLNIPAQKLATANPAGFPVHILGNEVLKRFNTILDFHKNYIYLKNNKLMYLPYTDAS